VNLSQPLARVDWASALLFCNWLSRAEGRTPCYRPDAAGRLGLTCDFQANGYRLPTEAEWEYCYRHGTTTRYVTGDDIDRLPDYGRLFGPNEGGAGKAFLPNPWGLFDLLGNAWEICWDEGYPRRNAGLVINPVGPAGTRYAMRGGSAAAGLYYLEASGPLSSLLNHAASFRVVCGPREPMAEVENKATALAAFTRALDLDHCITAHPDSARNRWVRGEIRACLGEWDKAGADLRSYFALGGSGMARWFQTDWWVVGPYPENLKVANPPERRNLNPIKPVAAPPGVTTELRWKPVEADSQGFLDLGALFPGAEHISTYALMRVFCPRKQPVAILLGSDDGIRLWLNGRLVHEKIVERAAVPDDDAVPVTLEAGWNTLLARVVNVTGEHALCLRLSDVRGDRVRALADQGRWDEAEALVKDRRWMPPAQAESLAGAFYVRRGDQLASGGQWEKASGNFTRATQFAGAGVDVWYRLALLRLYLGDTRGYRKACQTILERFGKTEDPQVAGLAAWTCTLAPRAVADPRVPLRLAEKALTMHPKRFLEARNRGAALLRAGKGEAAVKELQRALALGKEAPMTWLLLALSHRQLGHADEARRWLAKAQQWTEQSRKSLVWSELHWSERIGIQILSQEASSVISDQ
jgi:tetratricopeptide (TPR) repeat protein